jgi:hypothetical protein
MKQIIKYHLEYKPVLSFTLVDVPDEPVVMEMQQFLFNSDQIDKINALIAEMNESLMAAAIIPLKY